MIATLQGVAIRDAESIRESATKSNQAVHAAQTPAFMVL